MLLAALLLGGREVATIADQNAVSVTLVGGRAQGSGGATDASATSAKTPRLTPPTPAPAKADTEASGERLDELLAPPVKPAAVAPTAQSAAKGGAATANATGATGSSRAGQGLGPGEGAEGADLYAGASLPDVGRRSAEPVGDLWRQVSACWRPAAPRRAALLVNCRLTAASRPRRRPYDVRARRLIPRRCWRNGRPSGRCRLARRIRGWAGSGGGWSFRRD